MRRANPMCNLFKKVTNVKIQTLKDLQKAWTTIAQDHLK